MAVASQPDFFFAYNVGALIGNKKINCDLHTRLAVKIEPCGPNGLAEVIYPSLAMAL